MSTDNKDTYVNQKKDNDGSTKLMSAESEGSSVPLSAAERRERRRARILEDSDARMKRILSGPDGNEQRNAPAMEGGEGLRIALLLSSSRIDTQAPKRESPSLEELDVKMPQHQFLNFMNTARVQLVLAVGVLFRVLVAFHLMSNVVGPWIMLFFSYELLLVSKNKATFPEHGYLVNTLMWFNISERFVVTAGFVFESVWNFAIDSATMALAFLLTHSALDGLSILSRALL